MKTYYSTPAYAKQLPEFQDSSQPWEQLQPIHDQLSKATNLWKTSAVPSVKLGKNLFGIHGRGCINHHFSSTAELAMFGLAKSGRVGYVLEFRFRQIRQIPENFQLMVQTYNPESQAVILLTCSVQPTRDIGVDTCFIVDLRESDKDQKTFLFDFDLFTGKQEGNRLERCNNSASCLRFICDNCGKHEAEGHGTKLVKCSGCKSARYCNRKCQHEHWKKGHRESCETAKKLRNNVKKYVRAGGLDETV